MFPRWTLGMVSTVWSFMRFLMRLFMGSFVRSFVWTLVWSFLGLLIGLLDLLYLKMCSMCVRNVGPLLTAVSNYRRQIDILMRGFLVKFRLCGTETRYECLHDCAQKTHGWTLVCRASGTQETPIPEFVKTKDKMILKVEVMDNLHLGKVGTDQEDTVGSELNSDVVGKMEVELAKLQHVSDK